MSITTTASRAQPFSNLLSKSSRAEASLQSSMDQGAAPNSHARKPRFFRAVPPGSKLAASLGRVQSRVWLVLVLAAACALYFYFVSAGGLRNWPVYGTYLDLQADGFRSGHTYLPLK